MAFPKQIKLPGGVIMTIADALSRTITPRWFYGNMRRDRVSASKLGNSYQPVVMETAAQTMPTPAISTVGGSGIVVDGGTYNVVASTHSIGATASGSSMVQTGAAVDPLILDGAITMKAKADVQCAKFDECDDLNHIASRPDPALRTMVEYWASATEPGFAFTAEAGTTLGSAEVVLSSNALATVGQKITAPNGTFIGDPAAVYVLAVEYIPELPDATTETQRGGTKLLLSHVATATVTLASGDVTLTFAGSELIAHHTPEGDIAAGGSFSLLI